MRGRLVVFEGGEGAGKSTQLRRLSARLSAAGVAHRVFREPGGTPLGDRIRELVLHSSLEITPSAEAALFVASRAQLVAREILPALEGGEHVLLDRFLLSSYAYQSAGRGLPLEIVRGANRLAVGSLVPDLTVLLTLGDPSIGLRRVASRGKQDRIEHAESDFHWRVQVAFTNFAEASWQASHPECGRIVAIDGSGSEDEVEDRVRSALRSRIPGLFGAAGVA